MTKTAFMALQNEVKMLALQIGLRPAARAVGLNETRVLKWSQRGKWGINGVHPVGFRNPSVSSEVIAPSEVLRKVLSQHSDRTRLGLAISATTASEHLADKNGGQLCAPATAISADQWSRVADRTHGWSAERAQGATVNVAVVAMPGEADRAQREAMHARLDDIAAALRQGDAT